MVKRLILLAVSPLLLLLASCEKQEFTEPAPLELELSANESPAMGGRLIFGELTMHPASIEIKGLRSAGGDVFFDRNLQSEIYPLLRHPSIRLDIPQGIYNRLTINLSIEANEELEADFDDELEDLLRVISGNLTTEEKEELGELIVEYRQEEPAFLYTGTYTGSGTPIEVILAINDPFVLEVSALDKGKSRQVVLEKGRTNKARLHFDVAAWFSIVPAALIEKATLGTAGGKKYLLIHKKLNPELFNLLYNRIEQFTTLAVNE